MIEADLEAVRRVDLAAASALQQFEDWDAQADGYNKTASRLRDFYGRQWVRSAAVNPALAEFVDPALLEEFRDVLDEPDVIAAAAFYEAAEHCRVVEERHRLGDASAVALAAATAEREIRWCRWKREVSLRHAAGGNEVARGYHLATARWMDAEIVRLTDEALGRGVPADEIQRMTTGGQPWPAR